MWEGWRFGGIITLCLGISESRHSGRCRKVGLFDGKGVQFFCTTHIEHKHLVFIGKRSVINTGALLTQNSARCAALQFYL